jgi:hypothetical protein
MRFSHRFCPLPLRGEEASQLRASGTKADEIKSPLASPLANVYASIHP